MPELASRFEKEESKGLVIIGVTDEAPDVVDKWLASKKKTGYPIVILNGELEKLLDVPGYPWNGVIDNDGKISYAGSSPETAIKKALKTAKPGSIWPKKMASVAALMRVGKLGEAWTELQAVKTAGGLSERETAVSEKFATYLTEVSADAVKAAQELVKRDRMYEAMKKVELIASAKPELPATPDAVKLVAEIKAVPTYELEMKGGALFAVAVDKADADDYAAAVNAYKDVMKKAEGSKIAGVAKEQAEKLITKGMPGFKTSCDKCKTAKRACEKHAEPMKL